MRLKHSFITSQVTLVFEGAWKEIASATLTNVPDYMWIDRHEKTLDLTMKTEPIDFTMPVGNQTYSIDAAMEAAERLLPFAKQVQQTLVSTGLKSLNGNGRIFAAPLQYGMQMPFGCPPAASASNVMEPVVFGRPQSALCRWSLSSKRP
ncbi:MAG: hypothetical protein WDN50_05505 [Bradyrhizobium sp.]